MTDTQTRPADSGAGSPTTPEKKAGFLAVALGFLMGGPIGGVVMAMAVGIEQAFGKAGWTQPGWLGGDRPGRLTPEQLQARHDAAVAEAQRRVAQARADAAVRRARWAEHRRRMREWVDNGRSGDRPERPDRRGLGEILGNLFGASKSWYTLIDDKFQRGDEKIKGFFSSLWGFFTGFGEGFRRGWNQWEQERQPEPEPGPQQDDPDDTSLDDLFDDDRGDPEPQDATSHRTVCPNCGGPNSSFEPVCFSCRRAQYADGIDPEPEYDEGPEPGEEREPIRVDATVGDPIAEPAAVTSGPAGPGGASEGELMPTGTDVAPAAGAAVATGHGPQGTTNLDLLFEEFRPLGPLLEDVQVRTDELDAERGEITYRVRLIAALVAQHGAPTIVHQIMSEATQTAHALGRGVMQVSVQNITAQDLVIKALRALKPAEDNQADLHAADTSGDILDRVGS